jgi:hypothetical protein
MPAIFPIDEAIEIGEVTGQYSLTKSFSITTPKLQVPVMGFNIDNPVTAGIDYRSKRQKTIEYGYKIPRVLSGTAGNNTAGWKYYLDEALEPRAQYRTDMTGGLPLMKSKDYRLKMTLTVKTRSKFSLDPKPIEYSAPIMFK